MNETRSIIEAFDAALARGERCALATLVSVEGSAYRRPGARMLVSESGAASGAISAGCLESDVIERAKQVIRDQRTKVAEYDTSSTSDEMAWGLGLGCDGIIRVLVEPLPADSSYMEVLRRSCAAGGDESPIHVATLYGDVDETRAARLIIANEEAIFDNVDGELASNLEAEVRAKLASSHASFELAVGDSNVFVETIFPPVRLVIFGAGPDVLPVVNLGRQLGWWTQVVDLQARAATQERFAAADVVTLARPDELSTNITITARTMTLVMTHNYVQDIDVLRVLLASPAAYIGVVGARRRAERMLQEIGISGDDRLHAPAGLDIAATGPVEIALSIVAEMRAVLDRRRGGMLRERLETIHVRAEAASPRKLRLATA